MTKQDIGPLTKTIATVVACVITAAGAFRDLMAGAVPDLADWYAYCYDIGHYLDADE